MIKLDVKLTLPDKTRVVCGEMVTTPPDSRGMIQGAFRYAPEYLKHPAAFPLDPVNLPLSSKEFPAQRPEGVHAVFEDALPDDWGRKLLIQQAKLGRGEQTLPRLLEVMGANGLGALSFESKSILLDKKSSARIMDLEVLLEAALKYDAGLEMKADELRLLFQHGSSPGGARPKALVRKETGSFWIAKFPKHDDSFQVETIEAATLELAKRVGLTVPEFELHEIGKRKALLVKRFDISDREGRYHMISLQTLLQAQGYYYMSYGDLFEIVRSYSFQPSVDIPFLFRQMVFNVAMGNTDDHLKNFCMLHKEAGFFLSPAYDLLPDLYGKREHSLSFPFSGSLPPDRQILQRIGQSLNLADTDQIIDQVAQGVSEWQGVFEEFNVPQKELMRLEQSITQRGNALKKI